MDVSRMYGHRIVGIYGRTMYPIQGRRKNQRHSEIAKPVAKSFLAENESNMTLDNNQLTGPEERGRSVL